MKKFIIFVIISVMVALTACSQESSNDASTEEGSSNGSGGGEPTEVPSEITFGAATVGGVWYTIAGAMSDKMKEIFPDSSVAIVEGGSTANLLGLGDGTFDIAFTNGEAISEANNGTGEFEEPINNFSTVATMYPNPVQIIVRADSDIQSVEDLKGKKVSPGIRGYSGELAFLRILDILGMSYDDLDGIEYTGTEEAANLLRDKHIDAWIGNLAAPAATWQEMDTTVGIRLISLDEDVIDQMYEQNPGYVPYTIEAGTYPNQDEDVRTVAPYTVLLVNNDTMPEDAVYEFTKMVVENNDAWSTISSTLNDFDAEYSVENNTGEMHPGAERYYKEIGVME
ncbi:C4-dicarboxylate ABC transporter substrate-binding protein [Compostibacillus humi]|uniref:C4-dicarboxylate ABC transporter substrate-binding protein n=1 Tax=Compostibacillus humi TaxID=1245525 RepID=A0A8J2ZNV5_9BACI|nr:TAXI family TRAP transporter solute-binding subunit [Compostibacillus humi]GGH67897.1 C4-dicarboxylate ABC transporter substrate-binding protein [Compostibacillus humi]